MTFSGHLRPSGRCLKNHDGVSLCIQVYFNTMVLWILYDKVRDIKECCSLFTGIDLRWVS